MKPELTKILDAEFVPPITKPEDLYNAETKETALALVKAGQQELQREIPEYALPPQAESKDPRSLMRRIGDSIVCTFLPETRTARIHKRIEEDKLIADAKAQYEWVASSAATVSQAVEALNTSYKNIADFICIIRTGIKRVEERAEAGQTLVDHNLEQLSKIKADIASGELQRELETILTNDPEQNAQTLLGKDLDQCKKEIAQTDRENEYIRELIDYHQRLLPACESSLKDIEDAIKEAQREKMDLGLTLTTYKGLTENQINVARAIQFLQDVQTTHNKLKGKMRQIDALVSEKAETLRLTAPNPRQLPVADPETVRIRAELEE